MLMYRITEGVHGQRKFGNPWTRIYLTLESGKVSYTAWSKLLGGCKIRNIFSNKKVLVHKENM